MYSNLTQVTYFVMNHDSRLMRTIVHFCLKQEPLGMLVQITFFFFFYFKCPIFRRDCLKVIRGKEGDVRNGGELELPLM